MFPQIVMLRDAGATQSIIFTHAGAVGPNLSRDTIAMLYSSLVWRAPKSAAEVRSRPFIDVAEFFGMGLLFDYTGPVPESEFARANHHSRIYLPADGEPALWENPVVAPGGASQGFYELRDEAVRAFEARGLKVRKTR
jgi:hypothetical protein